MSSTPEQQALAAIKTALGPTWTWTDGKGRNAVRLSTGVCAVDRGTFLVLDIEQKAYDLNRAPAIDATLAVNYGANGEQLGEVRHRLRTVLMSSDPAGWVEGNDELLAEQLPTTDWTGRQMRGWLEANPAPADGNISRALAYLRGARNSGCDTMRVGWLALPPSVKASNTIVQYVRDRCFAGAQSESELASLARHSAPLTPHLLDPARLSVLLIASGQHSELLYREVVRYVSPMVPAIWFGALGEDVFAADKGRADFYVDGEALIPVAYRPIGVIGAGVHGPHIQARAKRLRIDDPDGERARLLAHDARRYGWDRVVAAKAVRAALKRAAPGVKWSVRSDRSSNHLQVGADPTSAMTPAAQESASRARFRIGMHPGGASVNLSRLIFGRELLQVADKAAGNEGPLGLVSQPVNPTPGQKTAPASEPSTPMLTNAEAFVLQMSTRFKARARADHAASFGIEAVAYQGIRERLRDMGLLQGNFAVSPHGKLEAQAIRDDDSLVFPSSSWTPAGQKFRTQLGERVYQTKYAQDPARVAFKLKKAVVFAAGKGMGGLVVGGLINRTTSKLVKDLDPGVGTRWEQPRGSGKIRREGVKFDQLSAADVARIASDYQTRTKGQVLAYHNGVKLDLDNIAAFEDTGTMMEMLRIRRQLVALRRQYAREGTKPSPRVTRTLQALLDDLQAR